MLSVNQITKVDVVAVNESCVTIHDYESMFILIPLLEY